MILNMATYGQSIIGQWETYDDKTKEKKAVIEIYELENRYFAKIVESFVGAANAICETCKGKNKDMPIIGLVIIEDLKKDGDESVSYTHLTLPTTPYV